MAHYAEINEFSFVTRVIVIGDEFDNDEKKGEEYCQFLTGSTNEWIRTSYNNKIRFNFAGIGMYYDKTNDAFVLKKPHKSWLLTDKFRWIAPITYPTEGGPFRWDEKSISWVEIVEPVETVEDKDQPV